MANPLTAFTVTAQSRQEQQRLRQQDAYVPGRLRETCIVASRS
jgi:hypothetical protein